ncbi:cysteine desulfurase family protein [Terriglobus tenax]|uniref:cysteine desulfurase family protein n=1 Tax=Terriglobus tenax TaxID=1111115 RepID=UPI0021E0FC83|nr:cysteine desulfurase family protein [Terriglobus tenax]
MRRVYLDANATTQVLPEVLETMLPFYTQRFGNASSIHQPGQQARAAVEQARNAVAALLKCRAAEVVFTSGGTESDNLALFGTLQVATEINRGDHLITSAIEHHAILNAAEELERRGVEVTILRPDSAGVIQPETLRSAMRENTRLVSIMMANNETGVIQPIKELAAIAHEGNALFHTDAVQAAGKLAIDVKALGVDLLSISGHKMYAPQGTGALYVRRGLHLRPLLYGGSHERQRRAGTENLPGIAGLGRAAEIARGFLESGGTAELARLRDKLEAGILASVPQVEVNGAGAERVVNTTNLYFAHLEAEALVIAMDLKGVAVSGGSACQSGATDPSHVLLAMGLSPERSRASIRFSLSRTTTEEEIDAVLAVVPEVVARLRSLSPAWQQALAVPA